MTHKIDVILHVSGYEAQGCRSSWLADAEETHGGVVGLNLLRNSVG